MQTPTHSPKAASSSGGAFPVQVVSEEESPVSGVFSAAYFESAAQKTTSEVSQRFLRALHSKDSVQQDSQLSIDSLKGRECMALGKKEVLTLHGKVLTLGRLVAAGVIPQVEHDAQEAIVKVFESLSYLEGKFDGVDEDLIREFEDAIEQMFLFDGKELSEVKDLADASGRMAELSSCYDMQKFLYKLEQKARSMPDGVLQQDLLRKIEELKNKTGALAEHKKVILETAIDIAQAGKEVQQASKRLLDTTKSIDGGVALRSLLTGAAGAGQEAVGAEDLMRQVQTLNRGLEDLKKKAKDQDTESKKALRDLEQADKAHRRVLDQATKRLTTSAKAVAKVPEDKKADLHEEFVRRFEAAGHDIDKFIDDNKDFFEKEFFIDIRDLAKETTVLRSSRSKLPKFVRKAAQKVCGNSNFFSALTKKFEEATSSREAHQKAMVKRMHHELDAFAKFEKEHKKLFDLQWQKGGGMDQDKEAVSLMTDVAIEGLKYRVDRMQGCFEALVVNKSVVGDSEDAREAIDKLKASLDNAKRVVQLIQDFRKEGYKDLQSEIDKERRSTLESAVQGLQLQRDGKETLEKAKQKRTGLEDELQKLQQARQALLARMQEQKQSVPTQKTLDQLQKDQAELKRQQEELEKKESAHRRGIDTHELVLQGKRPVLKALESEIDDLERELDSSDAVKRLEIQGKLIDKGVRQESLEEDISLSEKRQQKEEVDLASTKEQLLVIKGDMAKKARAIAAARQALATVQAAEEEVKAKDREIKALKQAEGAAEKRVDVLEKSQVRRKRQLDGLDEQLTKLSRFETKVLLSLPPSEESEQMEETRERITGLVLSRREAIQVAKQEKEEAQKAEAASRTGFFSKRLGGSRRSSPPAASEEQLPHSPASPGAAKPQKAASRTPPPHSPEAAVVADDDEFQEIPLDGPRPGQKPPQSQRKQEKQTAAKPQKAASRPSIFSRMFGSRRSPPLHPSIFSRMFGSRISPPLQDIQIQDRQVVPQLPASPPQPPLPPGVREEELATPVRLVAAQLGAAVVEGDAYEGSEAGSPVAAAAKSPQAQKMQKAAGAAQKKGRRRPSAISAQPAETYEHFASVGIFPSGSKRK